MQTCATCGTRLLPLFTSLFCPNDCGRLGPEVRCKIGDATWSLQILDVTRLIPLHFTHGSWLYQVTQGRRVESILELSEKELKTGVWCIRAFPGEFSVEKDGIRCIREGGNLPSDPRVIFRRRV